MVIFHCYVSSPEGIKTENHLSVGLSEMLGRVIIFFAPKNWNGQSAYRNTSVPEGRPQKQTLLVSSMMLNGINGNISLAPGSVQKKNQSQLYCLPSLAQFRAFHQRENLQRDGRNDWTLTTSWIDLGRILEYLGFTKSCGVITWFLTVYICNYWEYHLPVAIVSPLHLSGFLLWFVYDHAMVIQLSALAQVCLCQSSQECILIQQQQQQNQEEQEQEEQEEQEQKQEEQEQEEEKQEKKQCSSNFRSPSDLLCGFKAFPSRNVKHFKTIENHNFVKCPNFNYQGSMNIAIGKQVEVWHSSQKTNSNVTLKSPNNLTIPEQYAPL